MRMSDQTITLITEHRAAGPIEDIDDGIAIVRSLDGVPGFDSDEPTLCPGCGCVLLEAGGVEPVAGFLVFRAADGQARALCEPCGRPLVEPIRRSST